MHSPETNQGYEAMLEEKTQGLIGYIRSLGYAFAALNKDEAVFLKNDPTGKQYGEHFLQKSKDIVALDSEKFKEFLGKIVAENPRIDARSLLRVAYPEAEMQKQQIQRDREET